MRHKLSLWNLEFNVYSYKKTLTINCGLVFYPSLSLVNEDHNKEYPLAKFKQFSRCGFGEISSQPLTTFSYIRTRYWKSKQSKKEANKQATNQVSKHVSTYLKLNFLWLIKIKHHKNSYSSYKNYKPSHRF